MSKMYTEALVVAEADAPFELQGVQLDDDLRDKEVLVEMQATGVCHTDLHLAREKHMPGLFPAVFGHEGAAVVLRIGSKVKSISPGDHVIMTYTCCGECKYCVSHETSFCYDWEPYNIGVGRLDGSKTFSSKHSGKPITSHFFGQSSFSKHAVVSENGLVKVAKDVPLETVAPLGCGIMTGAGAMLNVVRPAKDSTVVVVGVGAVGLAALMAVKLSPVQPAKVIAVDVVPERLELAKKYGATHVVNSKETPDLEAALMALTNNRGVDGSIDATGRPSVVEALLNSAGKKGLVVSVGVDGITTKLSTTIFKTVNSGRMYVGCCMGNCYPQEFIPMLIAAWRSGDFPFSDLIKTYKATDMATASKDVLDGKVVKAVLVWK